MEEKNNMKDNIQDSTANKFCGCDSKNDSTKSSASNKKISFDTIKYYVVLGIIVLSIFYLFRSPGTASASTSLPEAAVVAQPTAGEQAVQLSFQNGNYYPQVIRVKQNIPVKMVVDLNTVKGCMRTVIIPKFGVRKSVTSTDNIITFTPTEKGEFGFSCGMGMGTGKIIVE